MRVCIWVRSKWQKFLKVGPASVCEIYSLFMIYFIQTLTIFPIPIPTYPPPPFMEKLCGKNKRIRCCKSHPFERPFGSHCCKTDVANATVYICGDNCYIPTFYHRFSQKHSNLSSKSTQLCLLLNELLL